MPAIPGSPAASGSPMVSAPSIASAMWVATGSTRRRHTGMVFSIHSARLHAATWVLTRGKLVASSSQTSASETASVIARCWPLSGVGSGPSAAAVFRAVSLVISQLTPEPESVGVPPNIAPAPPRVANAFCNWAARAFMSPPLSEDSNASKGLTGSFG